jgi:DNA modification methylase
MAWRVLEGDCREVLATLPAESVQTCVTSPPYWGLRDYGHEGQLGLEATPEEYVARMVEVFREVRRVLRPDGTLWLNLGDSYAGNGGGGGTQSASLPKSDDRLCAERRVQLLGGLKPKDLVGIPWRVAFALQADGWWLRSDIVWAKPNPMPESVTDRPTKAHEYVFLFAKSERYLYDADAIREPLVKGAAGSEFHTGKTGEHQLGRASAKPRRSGNTERKFRGEYGGVEGSRSHQGFGVPWEDDGSGRNRRSVWSISTKPFSGAHFAVMPWDLAEPCVLAGSRHGDTVLDPFAGSGTVGMVARRHGRSFVGVELNPTYAQMARDRIVGDAPLLNRTEAA